MQIAILMLNSLLMLPDLVSFSPADFLHEMAPNTNISLPVTGLATLTLLTYCLVFARIGVKRLVP